MVTNTKQRSSPPSAPWRYLTFVLDVLLIVIVTAVMIPSAPVRSAQPTADATVLDELSETLAPLPETAPGQSATLLPDGRWLLVGGRAHPAQIRMLDPGTTQVTDLSVQLSQPRSEHAASLMPDGTVLILGGLSPNGR